MIIPETNESIGNPTFANANLDRIVHVAYRIEQKGESLRREHYPNLEKQ